MKDTVKAPALKPGDTIGVMAPSSYVEKADIEKSKALMEKRGYKVFIHPQTYERHHQSAGTHLQKTLALQGLWQRADIKAIWTAGGGNRALHLLDMINFKAAEGKPKILIGFSDVTALLNAYHAHNGLITFHGPVFKELYQYPKAQIDHTLGILAGEKAEYPIKKAKILREGKAKGKLIGGCLSLFQYLNETKDAARCDGALLFLEDAGDHLSRIDRMFAHLKRQGVFEKISGLILGEFLDMQDGKRPFGFTMEEMIAEYTEGLDIPVILNAPFGHGKTLYTFPVGCQAALDTQKRSLKLTEKAVK